MIVVYLEKHVRTFRHLCKNVACYSFVVGDEASHLVWSHYMGCSITRKLIVSNRSLYVVFNWSLT